MSRNIGWDSWDGRKWIGRKWKTEITQQKRKMGKKACTVHMFLSLYIWTHLSSRRTLCRYHKFNLSLFWNPNIDHKTNKRNKCAAIWQAHFYWIVFAKLELAWKCENEWRSQRMKRFCNGMRRKRCSSATFQPIDEHFTNVFYSFWIGKLIARNPMEKYTLPIKMTALIRILL